MNSKKRELRAKKKVRALKQKKAVSQEYRGSREYQVSILEKDIMENDKILAFPTSVLSGVGRVLLTTFKPDDPIFKEFEPKLDALADSIDKCKGELSNVELEVARYKVAKSDKMFIKADAFDIIESFATIRNTYAPLFVAMIQEIEALKDKYLLDDNGEKDVK